jgi:hypothetical protein
MSKSRRALSLAEALRIKRSSPWISVTPRELSVDSINFGAVTTTGDNIVSSWANAGSETTVINTDREQRTIRFFIPLSN